MGEAGNQELEYIEIFIAQLLALCSSGKPNAVVSIIEDGVVSADKHVSQNPQGAYGCGDIDAHESRQALGLAATGDLQHVLLGGEGVGHLVDDDLDVGEAGDDAAAWEDGLTTDRYCSELLYLLV